MALSIERVHQNATSVNPSIRNNPTENAKFSLKDTSKADVERLAAENESLREANELLKEQFKLTKGRKVNRKSLEHCILIQIKIEPIDGLRILSSNCRSASRTMVLLKR